MPLGMNISKYQASSLINNPRLYPRVPFSILLKSEVSFWRACHSS